MKHFHRKTYILLWKRKADWTLKKRKKKASVFYSQDLFCNRATFFDLITKEVCTFKKIIQLFKAADLYIFNRKEIVEQVQADLGP